VKDHTIENNEGKTEPQKNSQQDHYIVAIGASAGGLEAIHAFFDNLTETSNLSFVIIQHLSPDYKSLLVDLVSKHTHMKVFEAAQSLEVKRNCIYVIPPKKLMTISGGRLRLSDKLQGDKSPNTAIDIFLRTLADDKGEKAIAIILSGTGSDGTKGAEAIKAGGGIVLVQDPATARFDGMPRSAAAIADFILSPEQMPAEIGNQIQELPINIFAKGRIDHALMDDIFKLVLKNTGCDFHHYKIPTLLRRISRRMVHYNFRLINNYIDYLFLHPEECKVLGKEFLIGVTRFFRDQPAYDLLEQKVIPQILAGKVDGDHLKIWICACSSGEEAYSLAILFNESLRKSGKQISLKIFATDIDAAAIERAAKGIYTSANVKDIPQDILDRYFVREGKSYGVVPEIRKQIVFAKHNIITDPPFIKNDLVSCRNMLIYMNNTLQKKILNTFNFSLNKGGFLFLGSSETIAPIKESMVEIDRKWKIFRKDEEAISRFSPAFQKSELGHFNPGQNDAGVTGGSHPPQKTLIEDLRESIIEDYGYAAIYIDRSYDIKEAVGDFRRYLSLPEHSLNLNLMKMVPLDLATSLGSAIRKAWKDGKKVSVKNIKVKDPQLQRHRSIDILVKHPGTGANSSFLLIVFGENDSVPMAEAYVPEQGEGDDTNAYINELKLELKESRLHLQAAIEGLETANEELQSTNEELLSSNEELQSSNEELQSLNEELHTLNTEHQLKINELIELNDDLNNFFRSIDIGQIFLDARMRIRKFNPSAVKLINLIEPDIGRPFSHISTNIAEESLAEDVERVMETGHTVEKEIVLHNGKSSLMRIIPYIRQDKRQDGVVLTFVDITTIKNLNNIISGVFNASQSAIIALKAIRNEQNQIVDFQFLTANAATEKFYSKKKEAFIGKSLLSVFPQIKEKGLFDKYVKVVERDIKAGFEYPVQCKDGTGWWEVSAVKMGDGLAVTLTDISEKKVAEERLRNNYNELIKAREDLKQLNADLESKVKERTIKLSESEERFRLVSQATNDAIWDWDLINNSLWLSDNFYSMFAFGKNSERVERKYWLEKIHPDDLGRVQESIAQAINNNSKQWTSEYRYIRGDGDYAYILDRGYILHDEYGTPYRMLSSMLDVTQLRKAERDYIESIEQREFLAESMPLIVWTASPAGKLNFINKNFSGYTGISNRQALGMGWESAVDPIHLQALRQNWKEAIRRRQDFAMELKLKRQDGTYRWHLLRARAKKNEDGRLMMWVGTNTDIHEQKLATEILEQRVADRTVELQKINKQLEISNHDLQQFASVASHDLKEPLRKIHMFSQMLNERYLKDNAGATEYIDRIIASSSRMTKLINDLLSFSRLSVNSLFEPVNINSILEEVLADLELAIQEKGAVVEVDRFPAIDAIPGQMRQVFQNIISNALKFTRTGQKPLIKVECARIKERKLSSVTYEAGRFIRIKISDNGIGFDEQFRDKIFTIFQRLHTKQQFEGTGIGLAICKKIIDKHNGLISAHGRENEGATFIIILPVSQQH